MSIDESIRQWIFSKLSTTVSSLGHLPPCPFAREALLKNKIQILTPPTSLVFSTVFENLNNFPMTSSTTEMIVIACNPDEETQPQSVQDFVWKMRDTFYLKNLWLLYDHPDLPETLGELSFNHGQFLLFMIQKLSTLCEASQELLKTDYYSLWPKNYFEDVVTLRQQYYEKYLASLAQKEQPRP